LPSRVEETTYLGMLLNLSATRLLRPRLGKALVGHPTQQRASDSKASSSLNLSPLAAAELKAPPSVLEVLGTARVLHHTVERHELGSDPSISILLLVVVQVRPGGRAKLITWLRSASERVEG
jgi:hypothetical protein